MIQIDMPMPKNCLACPACDEYLTCAIPISGRGWGEDDVREYGNGRPDWCPMKEQEVVVRCKDCKFWNDDGIITTCEKHIGNGYPGDWFCADGETKVAL